MKYVVYAILFFASVLLFFPRTGNTEIRNLPLLLVLLSLMLLFVLIRFCKYVVLVIKVNKHLKQSGIEGTKIKFLPWASFFHGHYSISFSYEGKKAQILLLSRKRKYQRYHFDSIHRLEFYRANRVVFKSTKIRGGTISELVEVKQVGKQSLAWDADAELRAILFDRLPEQITDCAKKEHLAVGERICRSNVCLLDWSHLSERME